MTSISAKLSVLANRPFWAMLPTQLEELFTRLMLELDGKEAIAEGVEASYWAVRSSVARVIGEQYGASSPAGTKTAVIPILGPLDTENSDVLWFGGTTYSMIQDGIEKAVNDPQVSEIVLLVDSPGGGVVGLPETADMIFQAGKVKPVTAIVVGMAASAAYHLASQASGIILTPSGEVGSVGVLMVHSDITKMLDKFGVKLTAIFAGKYKTEFWPFTPLTEEAQAAAQAQIDEIYGQFLANVKRGRGKRATPETIAGNFGEGRMLTANEALAAGMVDMVAPMREVFKARADRARMAAKARNRSLELL